MKRLGRIFGICIAFLLLLSAFQAHPGAAAQTSKSIVLDLNFLAPQASAGLQRPYARIQIPNLELYSLPGKPIVPFKTVQVAIPYGHEVSSVLVTPGPKHYLGRFDIQPGQEPVPLGEPSDPTPPDARVYDSTDPYPQNTSLQIGTQWKRGIQILILNLFPLQYTPASREVFWYESFQVRVETSPSLEAENALYRGLARDREQLRAVVDNPATLDSYAGSVSRVRPAGSILTGQYDYVIITSDALNKAPEPNFQTLADWKTAQGVKATIVTVEQIYDNYTGKDKQEQIRAFIHDAYLNNGIEYVLLGGDADGGDSGGESGDDIVPVRGLWAWSYEADPPNIPSDLYYACLDGTYDDDGDQIYGEPTDGPSGGEVDLMAEVYVGRAPVDSEQEIENFVNKTIQYEKSAGDAYLQEAWMLGELLWTAGGCALETAIDQSDASDKAGLIDVLHSLRENALDEAYVELYYEYSPLIKRILLQEPQLSIQLVGLLIRYEPAIRYLAGDPAGRDLQVTQADVDRATAFLRDARRALLARTESIGEPRVADALRLMDELEGQVQSALGLMASEAFRGSVYLGTSGEDKLDGETWGGDYKDEVKDGSCAHGYCTAGFPAEYNVQTLYDRDASGNNWSKSELIDILNGGVHLVNHLGHSNVNVAMKLYNSDVDALTNDKHFFGYSQGCYAGAFDNREPPPSVGAPGYKEYDCVAEHLVTNSTGAFAYIANSRYGWGEKQSTDGPSQYYDRQFWDAVFGERIANLGKANQDSKEDNIGFVSSGVMRFCYYELNLLGDPQTPLFDLRPQHAHDVAVTEFRLPTEAKVEEVVEIEVEIANLGKNDEAQVNVQLLQEDTVLETQTIATLKQNAKHDLTFNWSTKQANTYKLRVHVAPVSGEGDTSNNDQESEITIGQVVTVDDDRAQAPQADFTNIQQALDAAQPGDTIRVYAGTYSRIVVDKDVALIGVGRPLIDGQGSGHVVEIRANYASLEGFWVANSGWGDGSSGRSGILIESEHTLVADNKVTGSQCGICLNAASNNLVSNNAVRGGEYGIGVESSCSNNDIRHNFLSNNQYGAYGYDSEGATSDFVVPTLFTDNDFRNSSEHNAFDDTGTMQWNGNYWDDYAGKDQDADGFGDTPYTLAGAAKAVDGSPLIESMLKVIYIPLIIFQ